MKLRIRLSSNKVASVEVKEMETSYSELLNALSEHIGFTPAMLAYEGKNQIQHSLQLPGSTMLYQMPLEEGLELCIPDTEYIRVYTKEQPGRNSQIVPENTAPHCLRCTHRCTNIVDNHHVPETPTLGHSYSVASSNTSIEDSSIVSLGTFATNDGRLLVKRVVPGNNSCLFQCIINCVGHQSLSTDDLRTLICKRIHEDPEKYTEAILEMPPNKYCEWISQSSSWGGGIELSILSSEFKVEICCIITTSLKIYKIGDASYRRRIILLYDGVHYNYVAAASSVHASQSFDKTIFEIGTGIDHDGRLLDRAVELARQEE